MCTINSFNQCQPPCTNASAQENPGTQKLIDSSWDLSANQIEAIVRLCNRRYWKRIWVLQEVVLPPTIQLYCGNSVITAPTFEIFTTWASRFKDIGDEFGYEDKGGYVDEW
ncbi:hypothetical protein BCR34DRAFT_74500 [Clohesyomyces aquaticus]|uniref:Heterokaryon incompatibility domain-containing protein n=1 Tax=Clohesyomyces aquaticus TaxID=1231657 RepID=A0A1Y2A338_9PLEO|nr:hypothetical protein BCR34DRAFT_74500 [Clohesyomyces aquaticus]